MNTLYEMAIHFIHWTTFHSLFDRCRKLEAVDQLIGKLPIDGILLKLKKNNWGLEHRNIKE